MRQPARRHLSLRQVTAGSDAIILPASSLQAFFHYEVDGETFI